MFGGCEKVIGRLFGRRYDKEERKMEIVHCHYTSNEQCLESDDSFVSHLSLFCLFLL